MVLTSDYITESKRINKRDKTYKDNINELNSYIFNMIGLEHGMCVERGGALVVLR